MTVDQIHSPTSNTDPKNEKVTSHDVGLIFAREYYTFLNKKPNRLHAFYGADSLLVRGDEGESVPTFKGREEIRKKIKELDFDNCKVLVTQVDSQVSANDGVLISVLGEISDKDKPSQKFTETFFLAPQPNGYYVLNNIFRFLKETVDIDYYSCEEEEETKVEATPNHHPQGIQINHLDVPQIEKKKEQASKVVEKKEQVVKVEEKKEQAAKVEEKKEQVQKVAEKKEEVEPLAEKKETKKETKPASSKSEEHTETEAKKGKKEDKPAKKVAPTKKVEEEAPSTATPAPTVANNNNHSINNGIINKEQTQQNNDSPRSNNENNERNQKADQRGVTKSAGNIGVKSWASSAAPTPTEPVNNESTTDSAKIHQPVHHHNQQQFQQQILLQTTSFPSSQQHVQNNHIPQKQHTDNNYNHHPQQQNIHHHHPQQNTHQQHPQQTQQYQQYQYHNRDQQQQRGRADTQIFVKNVNPSMTEEQLEEGFNRFGPIKSVNLGHARNCAFIDFSSIESTQRALEQHKVMIGGTLVFAEERRPPRQNNYRQQQFDSNNNNRRYHQQNRRGGGTQTNRGGVATSTGLNVSMNNKRGAGVVGVGVVGQK